MRSWFFICDIFFKNRALGRGKACRTVKCDAVTNEHLRNLAVNLLATASYFVEVSALANHSFVFMVKQ